jgi:hypothetical protein
MGHVLLTLEDGLKMACMFAKVVKETKFKNSKLVWTLWNNTTTTNDKIFVFMKLLIQNHRKKTLDHIIKPLT